MRAALKLEHEKDAIKGLFICFSEKTKKSNQFDGKETRQKISKVS